MTSLARLYSSEFRRHLSYHPVWAPGTAVKPGDIGRFHEGAFVREANLRDRIPGAALAVARNSIPTPLKFSVGVAMNLQAGATASIEPSTKVKASVSFVRGGGMLFHARDIEQLYIQDVRLLLAEIPWDEEEWRDTLFVSEVHAARSVAVLLSESGGGSVEVAGKAGALQALDLADASVAFGTSSSAAYSVRLRDGKHPHPVALRLYRAHRNWLGHVERRAELQGFDPSAPVEAEDPFEGDPFEEVSPFEPVE